MYRRSFMRYAHAKGFTCVEYTQNGEFIITCGSDGDIRKWNGIDDDPSSHCFSEFVICIAQYGKRLLASSDLNTLQSYTFPDMERDGNIFRFTAPVTCVCVTKNYVAAGSEDTVIKVLYQSSLEGEKELRGHKGPLLAIDISCKGILASIGGDGILKVWDLQANTKVLKSIGGLPKANTFLEADCYGTPTFDPLHGRFLAYACGKSIMVLNTAKWGLHCILKDDRVKSAYSCCKFSRDGQRLAAGTKSGEISVFDFLRKRALLCETVASGCAGITSLVWDPVCSKKLAFCDRTGQLGTLSEEVVQGEKLHEKMDSINNFVDDDIQENLHGVDNDCEVISFEKSKRDTINNKINSRPTSTGPSDVDCPQNDFENKKQPCFQPGATPIDLEDRFLLWNSVGIVRTSADCTSILVEFHDTSVHYTLYIRNRNNYNMAGLSSTVLALSAEGATKLVCTVLINRDKEWSTEMPDCEGVQALVATSTMVAVITDMLFLRIFSVTGTQREIVSIPGQTLAIAGYHDRLFISYHRAAAYGEQHLSGLLLQTLGVNLLSRSIHVPLLPGRKLTWAGYTDRGSPVIADSMGLLQLYSIKSALWLPICDMMKRSPSVSNSYFVVDVSEQYQSIIAIPCRGCSYPEPYPKPIVTELPMQIPLCDLDTEKSQLEDVLIRTNNLEFTDAEKSIKETALKLFAIACNSELEGRARELVKMIASPKVLSLAVKYASKTGRINLSDKLSELSPQIEEQSKERELEERSMAADFLSIIGNTPLNSGLLFLQKSKPSSSTPTPIIAPKPMKLRNRKRSSVIKPPVQTNISNSNSNMEYNMSSQDSLLLSRPVLHSATIPSTLISIDGKRNENKKSERAFVTCFEKSIEELQAKKLDYSPTELDETRNLNSRSELAKHRNPFAIKRTICDVKPAPPTKILPKSGNSLIDMLDKYYKA